VAVSEIYLSIYLSVPFFVSLNWMPDLAWIHFGCTVQCNTTWQGFSVQFDSTDKRYKGR